ncbi:hypothetical protein HN419_07395 [Candidatus Woesearchaeota archaeon]|nr:hypothetical protein [Candidatus Woesearchaeota archaeon]MBT3538318.1 hypothetical protein [Candidatus Woesearchaeota archaeon]MBT7105987.1 hypothetical protein [Candidatus Woesearchaeota archaeon]
MANPFKAYNISGMSESIVKSVYSRLKEKAYTLEQVGVEFSLSENDAERLLGWLSSLDRELDSECEYKLIEKVPLNGEIVYRLFDPKTINPDMFRDYDYRSPSKGSLDFSYKRLFFMTLAWISMALDRAKEIDSDNRKVLVGRDCRKTAPESIEAVLVAIEQCGLEAIYVGEKPNCVASYSWATRKHAPLLGIFLTASHTKASDVMGAKITILGKHNELVSITPYEIRTVSRKKMEDVVLDSACLGLISSKNSARVIDHVEDSYYRMAKVVGLVCSSLFKAGVNKSAYDLSTDLCNADNILNMVESYEKEIVDMDAKPFKGLRVVVEGSHTPSGVLAGEVYRSLGADVTILHEDVWELEGQHKADPSILENLFDLMDYMKESKADFGLAFDLDGDRGAIVVPTKDVDPETNRRFRMIPPDNLMQATLTFFNERGYGVDALGKVAVVRDVLSSKGVDVKAMQLRYEPYQTDAGYVYLKAKVRALKDKGYVVPIYAERSGHAWTHVTGVLEDPIVFSLFFVIMGLEYKSDEGDNFFEGVLDKTLVHYKQSTRFQPLFADSFLEELSKKPGNVVGWKPGNGGVPSILITMGRHEGIRRLMNDFKPGSGFDTPVGKLTVTDFNTFYDDEAKINRFADIRFELNGKDAGSFVFRASSNDPTWVCSFETPLWEGEASDSKEVLDRYDSVGGLVLDYLERKELAKVSGEGFTYSNKVDAEKTLLRYRLLLKK